MENIAHADNIGSLKTVSNNLHLIRFEPQDFNTNNLREMLPSPSFIPCFFDETGIDIALERYKGIIQLLEKGRGFFNK